MSNVSKDDVYMKMAEAMSTLSKANRKKVGAVLVTKNGVVLTGCNGTASGSDNTCEDSEGNTKPEVLHAELNCILKAAKEGVSVLDSTLYVTLSPCLQCAAMLVQAGVKEVRFKELYRCDKGLRYLIANHIDVFWSTMLTDEQTFFSESKTLDEYIEFIRKTQS